MLRGAYIGPVFRTTDTPGGHEKKKRGRRSARASHANVRGQRSQKAGAWLAPSVYIPHALHLAYGGALLAWQTVAEAPIRVLVVEDVERLAELIARGLGRAGFQAETASSAAEARDRVLGGAFDAVVLDLGLPDGDGLDLLREFRAEGVTLPVLILTTRVAVEDRVEGLNTGADDYLTKPFAFEELEARLRALLRRPASNMGNVLRLGNLAFDTQSREVLIAGRPVVLSAKELMLLEQLLRRAGHVVSKVFLEDNIYGEEAEAGNALEVLVHRLRARLRDIGADVKIHTVRGVGYLLAEMAPAEE